MCHISNGAGQCLFRCKEPTELANVLRYLADYVTSDDWMEKWMELEHISDQLITEGEICLDDAFIDVGDFKKSIGVKKNESLLPAMEVDD
jgi:hypothetical protein